MMIGGSTAAFGLTNPEINFYQSDFRDSSPMRPLGEWSCFGSGKMAKDVNVGNTDVKLNSLFTPGSDAFISIDFENFGIVYCSNSSTVEGGAADEWLVSPAIDISGAPDNLVLGFDVFAYGNSTDPKYEVYVSTTGNTPEDFTKALYTAKSKNSPDAPVCTRVYRPIDVAGSQVVYLAFVNKSRDAQILGFKDISISEYELELVNNTPSYFEEPTDVSISCNVGIQTPVKSDGYTAVLSCKGEEQIFTSYKQTGTAYVNETITFPNAVNIQYGESLTYTVTVTPNYEGATSSTFEFDMGCMQGYPSVCVEEEATGTWCGWCIRGIAGLNQFSDEYGDRFIGIGVHATDPMEVTTYLQSLSAQTGIVGYPSASFNRGPSTDPYSRDEVERILSKSVGYAVNIKSVTYNENTGLVTVTYAPKLAFNTTSANISAAVVVTEDDVTGKTGNWNQTNNYAGYTEADITEQFGAAAWPYFKKYCEGFPTMPFVLMSYNHVAHGIFNSFNGGGEGGTLPAEWNMDEEQEFTLTFDMPVQREANGAGVQNWKNTHMVVLILDNVTGKILTAAKMGADHYNETGSAEETLFSRNVDVAREGANIRVSAEGEAMVSAYNMYGLELHKSTFTDSTVIDGTDFHGPVIVKVVRGNDSFVKKIMF